MHQTIQQIDTIATQLVDAAVSVHRTIGSGLLESTYHACLAVELRSRGLELRSNVELPVTYKGLIIAKAYRVDLVVERLVIAELKAVPKLLPIHEAQLLT